MTLHGVRLARVFPFVMKCVSGFLPLLLAALPAFGGEFAVFSSGLKLHAERHEQSGDVIRLYNKGGFTEIPAALVSGFEQEEFVAPKVTEAAVSESSSVVAPAPALQVSPDPRTMVRDAALRSGLPPEFVASVALVESGFRPDAVSPKGALGVMQLMPGTAKMLGADPRDTAQNIDAGARLLRELLLKYDGDVVKALSAYNAGEGAVDRYQGIPPYNETRWYVKKVVDAYQKATQNSSGQ